MYIEHFGLTGQPFQLTPDARFWYESRTHKKAMAYLGYGLAQAEGFIVITGEIGAGKSTLVAHLMASIDRARLNAVSLVSTQVEGDDMLRLAAQGFGVAVRGVEKAALLDAVEQRLDEEVRAGKRNLLIVDEVQNLPVSALEELRMLSNFQIGGRPLLQIVLLGQPEFRDKLAAPALEQLRQRVIATHHLEAMDGDEIAAYVLHRLTLVGWQGTPDFLADSFAAIHARTGGIPRRVNKLAHRLLLHAAVGGLSAIEGADVEVVAVELEADAAAPRPTEERVLPLRSARLSLAAEPEVAPATSAAPAPQAAPADPSLARRIAALEARAEEQEAILRRVLTLLVDWVEGGNQDKAYKSNAA